MTAAAAAGRTALAHAPAKEAGREVVLIELFSSAACESCGPAHELIGRLAARGDVIALTFPVDYWNYLGPQDRFARAEFTERQKAYARQFGHRAIYTPQVVVNGATQANGMMSDTVSAAIEAAPATLGPRIEILQSTADAMTVQVSGGLAGKRAAAGANVWLARYAPGPSAPGAAYVNTALALDRLGEWTGAPQRFEAPACLPACVVIVQQDKGGPVLSARRFERAAVLKSTGAGTAWR